MSGRVPPSNAPSLGTAVPRPGQPLRPYGPGYRGWPSYGFYGGAFGLGLYGYEDLYGDGLWGDPYFSPYAYDAYASPFPTGFAEVTGGLRLDVKPKSGQVFVDGYYAGIVDDFNGHFQHLDLVPGPHHVEVRAPGCAPVQFDVNIEPHQTIKYHGQLTKN